LGPARLLVYFGDYRRLCLPPPQAEQPAVAETPPLIGKIAEPAAQSRIRRAAGAVADHLPIPPTIEQARRSDRLIQPADARSQRVWRRALPFFERGGRIEHLLGQKLLQLRVLVL